MAKKKYRKLLVLAWLALAILLFMSSGDQESIGTKPEPPEGFSEVIGGDIAFQWKLSGDTLEGIMAAPTKGWVSIGFNPTEMMKEANFIIGYVDDGNGHIRDDWGTWLTSHAADTSEGGSSDVTLVSGFEEDGWTVLRFVIPLDSGDAMDGVITPGETTVILLAFGGSDNFTGIHRQKAKVEIVVK